VYDAKERHEGKVVAGVELPRLLRPRLRRANRDEVVRSHRPEESRIPATP
jgi:hypothetical protein